MADDGALYPVKKLVMLTEDLARRITEYRYDHRLPSDNAAVRELLERGLEAAGARAKRRKAREASKS